MACILGLLVCILHILGLEMTVSFNWPLRVQIHNLLIKLCEGREAKGIIFISKDTVRELSPDWWKDGGMI